MFTNKRSRKGNMLILTLATVLGFLIVIAGFVLNYNRILGSRQEAQTAADAAALAVARDLSRIVVDGKHGRIGLVDDTGEGNDLDSRPVTGINTLLATVRLDLLIADQLKNKRIIELAMQDYKSAREDAQALRNAIIAAAQGGLVKDKKRQTLDLVGMAQTVYDDNAHRIGRGKRKGILKVELGYVDDGITAIPTPSPGNLAQVNAGNSVTVNGISYYRANVPINTNVMGDVVPFIFSGSGSSVALVDNSRFHPITDNSEIIPSVIRVSGEESIELPGSQVSPGSLSHTIAVSAAVGGNLRYSTSGSLIVSFPQGFPSNSTGLNFDSVNGIMNSNGWNSSSPGLWFEAKGGAYPGNASARPEPSAYRGEKDTPANIALASMVYDWLRSLSLRPNINSVVTQLNVNLRNVGSKTIASNDPHFWESAYACPNMDLHQVTGAIFDLDKDPRGQEDFYKNPAQYRAQASHAWGYDPPAGTIAETALITSTDEGGNAISTNGESPLVLMQFYDTLMKMNGVCKETYENASSVMKTDVADMQDDVIALGQAKTDRTTMLAKISQQEKAGNASAVNQLKDGVSKLDDTIKEITERLHVKTEKLVRVERVRLNSMYALKVSNRIYENLKGLSGCGVKKEASDHFVVHGIRFLPPTRVATVAEIQGEAEIATGQNSLAPLRDWAAPYKKGKCQLEFFEFPPGIETPVASNSGPGVANFLDVPALAQSSVPINQSNVFVFLVSGMAGSQAQGGNIFGQMPSVVQAGQIIIHRLATTPYPGEDVLEGQLLYQNKQALRTTNADQTANTTWQAYGRDQLANPSGTYFADSKAEGASKNANDWCQLTSGESSQEGRKCPALAAEFSLRCPMVEPEQKCVPNVYYLGSASVQSPPTLAKDLVQIADMSDKLRSDPNNMALRADYVKMLYPYITSLKDSNLQAKQAYDYYIENAPVMAEFYYLLLAHDGVFSGFSFERGIGVDVRKVTPCSLIYVSHI